MTKKNKYYTPSIEEFHVGFRYEQSAPKHMEPSGWKKEEWYMHNFSVGRVGANIKEDYIRVKYLDQSDIEELGWVLHQDNAHHTVYLKGEGTPYNKLYIKKKDGKIFIEKTYGEPLMFYGMFEGKIKNYNELKKVMEMLGI